MDTAVWTRRLWLRHVWVLCVQYNLYTFGGTSIVYTFYAFANPVTVSRDGRQVPTVDGKACWVGVRVGKGRGVDGSLFGVE